MRRPLNTSPANQSLLAKRRGVQLAKQTEAEKHIQGLLVSLGVQFHAQKGFFTPHSHFIVDFYLPKHRKLCLEIDGGYHAHQVAYDKARDLFLTKERGFRVKRVANSDALAMDKESLASLIL